MEASSLKRYSLFAAGIMALAYAVTIFVYVPSHPYLGFYVFGDRVIQRVEPRSKTAMHRFRKGDIVVAIDDKPLRNYTDYLRVARNLRRGTRVKVQLEREGVLQEPFLIEVRRTPFPYDALLWCLVGLPIFGFGFYIFNKRPAERSVRLFCLFCVVTVCTFVGGLHWMTIIGSPLLTSIALISATMLIPVSLHFFLIFPEPKKVLLTQRHIKYFLYAPPVIFLVLMEYYLGRFYQGLASGKHDPMVFSTLEFLAGGLLSLAGVYFAGCLFSIFRSYRTSSTPETRRQIKWILWGAGVAAVPLFASAIYALVDFPAFAVGGTRMLLVVASLALLVSYAFSIIKYRLGDVDAFINKSAAYFIFAAVAVAIYYLIFVIASFFWAISSDIGDTLVIFLMTVLVLAFLFRPILERASAMINRRFYKERYEYQRAISQLSEALVSILRLDELVRTIVESVRRALSVEHTAVYLTSEGGDRFERAPIAAGESRGVPAVLSRSSALVRFLKERKCEVLATKGAGARAPEMSGPVLRELRALDAEAVVPFVSKEELTGFLVLGRKAEDDYFSTEDLRLLKTLANQASVAISNARSYKVIENLNRDLEQKIRKIEDQSRRILALQEQLLNENRYLKEEIRQQYNFEEIVGRSSALAGVLEMVRKVAPTESAVLIRGESGSGKELVARAIHFNSPRKDKPFIKVACSALAEGVLESELFGHEKGAFTGAIRSRPGRFELADGGTIFLDEIGDISLNIQSKLLRVLQEKEFERVGSTKTLKVDVRVIAATNRDLEKAISEGRFREDLYYRLNVISIRVPPLRERTEDIYPLAMHFLARYNARAGKNLCHIDDEAMELLERYDWPGNVRELENLIERAVVLADGDTLKASDFPAELSRKTADHSFKEAGGDVPLPEILEDLEKKQLLKALESAGGNKSLAARALGLKRSTFFSKLKKHGII